VSDDGRVQSRKLPLATGLTYYLSEIGWEQVRLDLRAPLPTLQEMFGIRQARQA